MAEIVGGCLEGVQGPTRGMHVCNGNFKGRPISPIVRNAPWVPLLQELDGVIDVAALECSYFAEWTERYAFAAMPQSMQLAAGIVDEPSYRIETVEKVHDRAADRARVVGEERLWISPSCGFGRHPARNRPVLKAKMPPTWSNRGSGQPDSRRRRAFTLLPGRRQASGPAISQSRGLGPGDPRLAELLPRRSEADLLLAVRQAVEQNLWRVRSAAHAAIDRQPV